MKIGDLVRYGLLPETFAFGIVVEVLGFFEAYNEDAVRIFWFDTKVCTEEKTREILDPEHVHYEVISEIR